MADQQLAGGIAWSIGEIPTVALAITVAVQWSRSDARESKRRDRQADRNGDAELVAYNAMLQRMASNDPERTADEAEPDAGAARGATRRDAAKEPQR
jgi:putative copper resistance protein D